VVATSLYPAQPALAAAITGTTGDVSKVDPPKSVLLRSADSSAIASNNFVYVFPEQPERADAGITLEEDLPLDVRATGKHTSLPGVPPAPEPGFDSDHPENQPVTVRSYFLQAQRPSGGAIARTGSVTFDTEIIGVIVKPSSLASSDFMGPEVTRYPKAAETNSGAANRGLELSASEWFTISMNRKTLTVRFSFGSTLDQMRVITEAPDTAQCDKWGTNGDDTEGNASELHGLGGGAVTCGLAGNDLLLGAPTADVMRGGSGGDKLVGAYPVFGAGDDDVFYGGPEDPAIAQAEVDACDPDEPGYDDCVAAVAWGDVIYPNDGDDTVFGDVGFDAIYYDGTPGVSGGPITTGVYVDLGFATSPWGPRGRTTRNVSGHTSEAHPQFGMDTIYGVEDVWGTNFDDRMLGTSRNEAFYGRGGNDRLEGGDGNDRLQGDDPYFYDCEAAAPNGNDTLLGGAGNDRLLGGLGDDTMNGGDGDDVVWFTYGDPPEGDDRGCPATPDHPLVIHLATTTGENTGHGFDTVLKVENVEGTRVGDQITGNAGDNTLVGRDGNDTIKGLAGDDILVAGDGLDTLEGGTGNDLLVAPDVDALADILDGGGDRDVCRQETGGVDTVQFCEITETGFTIHGAETQVQATAASFPALGNADTTPQLLRWNSESYRFETYSIYITKTKTRAIWVWASGQTNEGAAAKAGICPRFIGELSSKGWESSYRTLAQGGCERSTQGAWAEWEKEFQQAGLVSNTNYAQRCVRVRWSLVSPNDVIYDDVLGSYCQR